MVSIGGSYIAFPHGAHGSEKNSVDKMIQWIEKDASESELRGEIQLDKNLLIISLI